MLCIVKHCSVIDTYLRHGIQKKIKHCRKFVLNSAHSPTTTSTVHIYKTSKLYIPIFNVVIAVGTMLFIVCFVALFVALHGCLNGCTCQHGVVECLGVNAPKIPIFGRIVAAMHEIHITQKQLPWLERTICTIKYTRLETIYLHDTDTCIPVKLPCKKTVECW